MSQTTGCYSCFCNRTATVRRDYAGKSEPVDPEADGATRRRIGTAHHSVLCSIKQPVLIICVCCVDSGNSRGKCCGKHQCARSRAEAARHAQGTPRNIVRAIIPCLCIVVTAVCCEPGWFTPRHFSQARLKPAELSALENFMGKSGGQSTMENIRFLTGSCEHIACQLYIGHCDCGAEVHHALCCCAVGTEVVTESLCEVVKDLMKVATSSSVK